MKAIVSTIVGAIMFGTTLNALQVAGITFNTVGGCLFAWGKLSEGEAKSRAKEAAVGGYAMVPQHHEPGVPSKGKGSDSDHV